MSRAHWKRPDAKGRSSGKTQGRRNKEAVQPEKPYVPHPRALLTSDAWQAQTINCRRLIDFLEVEHMNHTGYENGNLKAPYDPPKDPNAADRPCLRDFGIKGRHVREAIDEAEFLGLVRVRRGGRWNDSNQPSLYRLTYLPTYDENWIAQPPTHEWKQRTANEIARWQAERREQRKRKAERKQKAPLRSSSTIPNLRAVQGGKAGGVG